MIEEGDKLFETALKYGNVGPYQIQAAISAVHAQAPDYKETDWNEIVLLYDRLYQLNPSPVVDLNRIVARSNITDLSIEINALNKLEDTLVNYQPFYAAKADFLCRLGQNQDAVTYFQKAIELSGNDAEKEFLKTKFSFL